MRSQIALVYLGKKPPKYIKSNLVHLRDHFPEADVWLITDRKDSTRDFESKGIKVWIYERNDTYWLEVDQKMNFPKAFRDGFWFLTLKRFGALQDFLMYHPQPLLHVEADVFLMPNFPLDSVMDIKRDLAFPAVGPGYAIASTLFIRNHKAISDLNKFVMTAVHMNPKSIDMTILHDYEKTYPDRVEILPSGPSFQGRAQGYFDGAAFGTYLLGQDPRNFRGRVLKFSPIDWHSDKINELDFVTRENTLIAIQDGNEIPVFSLHIHSKKESLFKLKNLLLALDHAARIHKNGPQKFFEPQVFFQMFRLALKRRLKRVVNSD
jgi:hypothetical protein